MRLSCQLTQLKTLEKNFVSRVARGDGMHRRQSDRSLISPYSIPPCAKKHCNPKNNDIYAVANFIITL